MDSLQRKQRTAFATPEKDSPNKKIVSPSEAFAGKKGFLSTIFSKKKANASNGFESELSPVKPLEEKSENTQMRVRKNKVGNRKNISDGRVKLRVIANDRVSDEFFIDYKDNPFDLLDQNPTRTTSFIENLKNRDFTEIDAARIGHFIENQNSSEIVAPPMGVENLELELLEVSKSYDGFLGKFFRFFQGLLAGFCVIHLFLIFAGSDDQVILNSYVLSALRINQIFYVVALISVLGAINRYIETRIQYTEASRSKPMLASALSKQALKYFIATLSFIVVYVLLIYNHEFVSLVSDRSGTITLADFSDKFRIYRILSSICAAGSIIGWFSLILAFEEVSKNQTQEIHYSEMTNDETINDVTRNV